MSSGSVWSDFFDYVLPELPGVGQDVATIAIRNAAIDFYERTGVLTSSLTPITTVAGTPTYALPLPAGYELGWIRTAWLNGNRIDPIPEDDIAKRYYNWQAQTGTPFNYLLPDKNTIQLYPMPDQYQLNYSNALTIRAVLKPSRSAAGIAEPWVFAEYVLAIAAGAKAELADMPAKPWSNPNKAVQWRTEYLVRRDDARRNATRSHTRASLQVKFNTAIYG